MTQYWISYSKIMVSYCILLCGGLCKKTKLYTMYLMRNSCKLNIQIWETQSKHDTVALRYIHIPESLYS